MTPKEKNKQLDYSITNLDVITYRNGDAIPEVKDSDEWSKLTTGAYCYYDNDPTKSILYNWHAVNDPRGLAPLGWKIPDDKDMDLLDLKINSQYDGYRNNNGTYNVVGDFGDWWSSTLDSTSNAWYRLLGYNYGDVDRNDYGKRLGFSVRCVRDVDVLKKDVTPKEKAKELVDTYSYACLLTTDGGKVAALIAVDEIKKVLYGQELMIRYDYWFEVKQEIKKL